MTRGVTSPAGQTRNRGRGSSTRLDDAASRKRGDGGRNFAIYSSRIIKAGALLTDTKALLAHWDAAVPAQEISTGFAARTRLKENQSR